MEDGMVREIHDVPAYNCCSRRCNENGFVCDAGVAMTARNWDEFFKPEDFFHPEGYFGEMGATVCANIANAILREELEKAQMIYGFNDSEWWICEEDEIMDCTHVARLIDIKPIEEGK